jgi:uncharacterized membrane protein
MTPIDSIPPILRHRSLRQIEKLMSDLLRLGVFISVVFLLVGILITFIRHPDYMTDKNALTHLTRPGSAFPRRISTLIDELSLFRGRAVMTVGLLALILTPVLRVAVSIAAFAVKRDWRFVLITSLVLIVLLISVFLGKTG